MLGFTHMGGDGWLIVPATRSSRAVLPTWVGTVGRSSHEEATELFANSAGLEECWVLPTWVGTVGHATG